jgi:MoaA/NifB/PqqE/SkfB family radical SAM enzyme
LFFYTLLGGEPLLYPGLWEILEHHRDCYFQIITNGVGIDKEVASRWRKLGNVTPVVSVDGFGPTNDRRRGTGTYHGICQALGHLRQKQLFFGVATTISRDNFEEVLSPAFVREMLGHGVMYLWYYILRPMGSPETAQLCLTAEQIVQVRRRLLQLRRDHPLLIVDTYWDEKGRAVCPAALGLGYHIGPEGSIEPCPPLSVAVETIQTGEDPLGTILGSQFLRDFAQFVNQRTRGCVILEYPRELAEFLRNAKARDYSGGKLFSCLENIPQLSSHHQPGAEIPEDSWVYRMLKRHLFFGLGGYG